MKKVLIVDDDADIRFVLAELLVNFGHCECMSLSSLSQVQDRLGELLTFNIALLDINLGNGNPSGVAVYEFLKKNGFTGKCVFLTGHAHSHPEVQEAVKIPGVELVTKPIGMDHLIKLCTS